jgi:aryl-alcohol dehydrogenase-like predicted oxidoreductase
MEHKLLGQTGVRVSAIGLGCGNFGGIGSAPELFGKGESEREAFDIMDAAWEMGINFFDTANAYGGGRSEAVIGRWLKARGPSVRQRLLLATKVFNPVGERPNERGLSRGHIMQQIDTSLTRLGVDYIDFYLIHEPDASTPIDETLGTLDDLVHAGKVRYIGASNMPAWLMARALWESDRNGWARFEWVQNSYSLLERGDEREMLPLCAACGLGYTPFSPLAGGWLTGKYRAGQEYPAGSRMTLRPEPYADLLTEKTFSALDRLSAAAKGRGSDMAALALAWVMAHPQVTAPIVGPRNPAHLVPARRALDIRLTADERNDISDLFAKD